MLMDVLEVFGAGPALKSVLMEAAETAALLNRECATIGLREQVWSLSIRKMRRFRSDRTVRLTAILCTVLKDIDTTADGLLRLMSRMVSRN
jgi:hypothetical protein